MRIVVTGGAGFIGSNLVRALLMGGNDVLVVDDLSSGAAENLDPRAGFRKLDILDDALPAVFAEFAPHAVVHLAAQSSVTVSIADPARDREVNVEGTRRVAAAARDAGAVRVISASSAAVYGEPAELPLKEVSAKAPINPYGESKLEAESALAQELAGTSTDYASFRFSNVYGPRQNAEGEGGVVAIFCGRIAAGQPPVLNGDGSQTRDFIYVGDVVNAVMTALNAPGPLAQGAGDASAYNISTGERISLQALVMALRQAASYFGRVDNGPDREGDIVHSSLDPTRAREVFGWCANVELETGIAMTWRWFAQQ